ncbi:oxygen-independent coproporphyrinogen III oxidase [Gymnodinialimonas hymeniacidonis]|uniref:oxygen-independent coproporphyrinogen III oxidase n=1 Tax=Gymnodinialimonas hymeniacidonis TaxID=3126508 RepID=UPI0034C6CCF4
MRRLGLFEANVPRYTSYPPANHFAGDVTTEVHRAWLAAIPPGSKVSLYAHVPFCRRLCWFCACRTQGMQSEGPVVAYTNTLIQEIQALTGLLPQGVEIAKLHWGGGTPTLLNAPEITRLADSIREAVPLTKNAEFSVEIDPNEIDDARLDALADAGMGRASIGVQDFDPEIQKIIGREQSFEVTRAAVEGLRARGVTSLNTDLLYGLPRQSQARITSSMQMLLSLNPDRVALYGYAHVPWMAKRQSLIPTEDLPDPVARLGLFETASEVLRWDGYDQIGIDHFARPEDSLSVAARQGRLMRNFQGYTDDSCDVLIGVGASSISKFPQGFVQNAASTAAYQKAVRAGELPTGRGHILTDEDRLRSHIIERLMCDFGVDQRGSSTFPRKAVDPILDDIARSYEGHVARNDNGLTVLEESRPLTRLIARHVDAYTSEKARNHSSAI